MQDREVGGDAVNDFIDKNLNVLIKKFEETDSAEQKTDALMAYDHVAVNLMLATAIDRLIDAQKRITLVDRATNILCTATDLNGTDGLDDALAFTNSLPVELGGNGTSSSTESD
jgi:hypothetical protein